MPTGRKLNYGALVDKAATLPVPDQVALKDPKDFKLIGTPAKRLDSHDKVNGKAQYSIDVKVPGMKIATVAACPVFGGKLAGVDEAKAKAVKGVHQVVRLDDAVAVVADHMWAAKQGLAALDIRWDEGPNAKLSTADIVQQLEAASQKPGVVARKEARPGRCRQGHGRRRPEGRGGLPGAVPRARHDGALELHRPRTQGRLRRVGGHPGRDPRPGHRRAGDRPSAREDPGA